MKSAYRLTGLSLVINKYRGYFLSNGDMQIQVNRMEGNMRNSTVMASVIFMVAGLQGCQDIFDKNTSQVPSEIGALVNEASSAYENFPRTLDRKSILKFYAADYTGAKDGSPENLKDLEKMFDGIAERIKLGDPIGISYKVTDLKIEPLTNGLVWTTYQDETKWGRGGTVLRNVKSRCSTLLRKEGGKWLVFHEHCSTVNG